MNRGGSMSGANNVPLGSRSGMNQGSLAQASASLAGVSLLNPEYLVNPGPPQSSGSKFGPVVANIAPPTVVTAPGLPGFGGPPPGMNKKLPNLELIASINATLMKKNVDTGSSVVPHMGGYGMHFTQPQVTPGFTQQSNSDGGDDGGKKRKRKSRWGAEDPTEKLFIPGLPTVLPANLSKEQEDAYILQLQIEDASRRLRTGDLGIPANPEERSPSPEPIYSVDGKRMNTREYRKRKEWEEKRHESIQKMLQINPDFKPPTDYKPPQIKVNDRVMIPQDEHPEINFVGLLIGPRGNTLKSMEKETGAKIIIRGKGSVKEGKVGRKDGHPLPGEDEPLHAYITATSLEAVKKAVEKIKEVIKEGVDVPEGQNDLRKHQLRELAQLNGTLREGEMPKCMNCGAADHKSWQCQDKPIFTNSIICAACGGAGHIAKDCVQKRPGQGFGHGGGPPQPKQTKIDEEYMSLMAELGEGPPPPVQRDNDQPPAWQQQGRSGGGFFNNRDSPRALMGPNQGGRGGGRGGGGGFNRDRRDDRDQRDYGNNQQHERGGWGNDRSERSPFNDGHRGPQGQKPPSLMQQNIAPPWNSENQRGGRDRGQGGRDGPGGPGGRDGGWRQGQQSGGPPHQQQGPPPRPGGLNQWNPPPPPPSSSGGGGNGPPSYGMPPPFFNAPPPPPPSNAPGAVPPPGGNSWGWGAGPGPVPPPPPPGPGRGGPPPGAPPPVGPPSYWGGNSHGGWQGPPPGGNQSSGLNLSNLIAPPPPPPK